MDVLRSDNYSSSSSSSPSSSSSSPRSSFRHIISSRKMNIDPDLMRRAERKLPQAFRDSGIEADLDPDQEENNDSCLNESNSASIQTQEDNKPTCPERSKPDLGLSTKTVMTSRIVPSAAKKSPRPSTNMDLRGMESSVRKGLIPALNQSNKKFLLPYRFLTPSKASIAKTIDDLFVPENGSREHQQKRLHLQPFLLSLIRGKNSTSGHTAGLVHQSGNIRDCRLSIDKALAVDLTSCITVTLPLMEIRRRVQGAARNACFTEIPKLEFTITLERDPVSTDRSMVIGRRQVWDAVYGYEFTPRYPGSHTLHVRDPDGYLYQDFALDVVGDDPVLSFNDASFWPVAVAVDDTRKKRDHCVIYVAYRTHIAEFLADGRYVKQLTQLGSGCYGQLAIVAASNVIAATVNSIDITGSCVQSCRHRLHLYHALSGRKLHDIAPEVSPFISSSCWLHIASFDDAHILCADGKLLFQIDVRSIDVIMKLAIDEVSSLSRVYYRDNKYYLADAGRGEVKVIDAKSGQYLSKIKIRADNGEHVTGLRGLAVDKHGNVITCDCLTGVIRVYDKHGTPLKRLRSEWEPVRWPLDLGLETKDDTYLYVVDHGNISIKKFRYL